MTTGQQAHAAETLNDRGRRTADEIAGLESRLEQARAERADIMRQMRAAHFTWAEVGAVFGMTRQRANKLGGQLGID